MQDLYLCHLIVSISSFKNNLKERDKEISHPWVTLQMASTATAGPGCRHEPVTQSGFLGWAAETPVLGTSPAASQVWTGRKLQLAVESGLKARHSDVWCGRPNQCLHHHAEHPALYFSMVYKFAVYLTIDDTFNSMKCQSSLFVLSITLFLIYHLFFSQTLCGWWSWWKFLSQISRMFWSSY